jgi:pimeloyl-ACP methyl ester carboxylesterase
MILEAIQRTIGYRFEAFAPRHRLPQVTAPVLLVHGDSDEVVPISDLEQLRAVRPDAAVLVVPDGGHGDLAPFEPYVGQITDFFRTHLGAQ